MSKNIHVVLDVTIPDEADPDTTAGWIFNHVTDVGTEADEYYESVDGYDVKVIE